MGWMCPAARRCTARRSTRAATIASPWPSAWRRLRAEGETLIQGAESAAISFPEFFDLLDKVADR